MNKRITLIVNVILPILMGMTIYFSSSEQFLRNYLPDGLWAYAFTSCILIIWDSKVNFIWLTLLGCSFIAFELLQSFHCVRGTGDIKDIFIYFIFGLLSLTINKILKTKINFNN